MKIELRLSFWISGRETKPCSLISPFTGSSRFFHFAAAPRRRLRQPDALQRQQCAHRNQLVERLLAEDLIDALRMVCHRRRNQHGIRGRVQLPMHFGMRQRVMRHQRRDVRQLGRFSLQKLTSRRNVEEQIAHRDAGSQRQPGFFDGKNFAAGNLDNQFRRHLLRHVSPTADG